MATVRVYGGKPASDSREGSPLLAGLLAGIGLIIVWVVIARMTHNRVSLGAWGIGGLIGIAVAKSARPPSAATGILAAIVTAVTLLAGKVAVVLFALQPALRDEFLQDRDLAARLYMAEMTKNHSFSPDLQRTLDTHPEVVRDTSLLGAGYELRTQMFSEASARAQASTLEERERLVHAHVDNPVVSQFSFWILLLVSFGPLSLLWMGLGIASAWKLGQGRI